MNILNEKVGSIKSAAFAELVEEIEMIRQAPGGYFDNMMVLHFLHSAVGLNGGGEGRLTKTDVASLKPTKPRHIGMRIGKIEDQDVRRLCQAIAAMHPATGLELWHDTPLYTFLNKRLITKQLPRRKTENWSHLKGDRSGFFDK